VHNLVAAIPGKYAKVCTSYRQAASIARLLAFEGVLECSPHQQDSVS